MQLYHWLFAWEAALRYGFPSRKLVVIGVTGTKGKSTVSELTYRVLTAAGHKTALASTIHFVIGDKAEPNLFKMTMPGRGHLQKFLRGAVDQGCTHAVIEMTSEGARQFRHKGIALDALVFTNIAPEHIESHGGFDNYLKAKLSLARALERSPKRPRFVAANLDDEHGKDFLAADVEQKVPFPLAQARSYNADDAGVRFVWRDILFAVPLPGMFNLYNSLAVVALCEAMGVPLEVMRRALEHTPAVAGRAERIECGQPFAVVVDYAHTADSLRALYETYTPSRIIAVLGNTGGGRDQWKRPLMGALADEYADLAILTNEDPYDEDPKKILTEMQRGFKKHTPKIVLDRRTAIADALRLAKAGDVVLITGKGTDPYIMGPRGQKEPWSDARVAQEELARLGYAQAK
ncbi:MAG: UDP-N-acetylmuramoyl-L-alanyl-D-glutamate--2,6-diaminopimelate ligase [Patescibacteria group bacterium]|nr:UDP-N-acetylmuramoyl-L-alanyl-D-glutamate--2,6-diaminopimelate ligase [Patescibacteria group bacterium]